MIDRNQIPASWEIVKLGEVCEKMTNGANVKQYDEKVGLPISRIETIWNETIDFSRVKYIQENEKGFVEKYSLINNDILFSHINSDSHLGKTAIYKSQYSKPLIHGINLLLLRPIKDIDADLFNYQLKFIRVKGMFAAVAQKAVNQSSINQAKLKQFDILFPPLPEQHRIVSKIEELFSELDKGIESLKTAQQQLKVYRQAVLKWAFEGRLTHENVKDGELPEGWKLKSFGELVENFDGKRVPLSAKYRENFKGKYPYYGACDIIDYVKEFLFDGEYLLIGEDGANLLSKNKPLAFIVKGKFWVNNHAHICKPLESINTKFIEYQFCSKDICQYITGTAQPKLTKANMNKIEFVVCSLSDQTKIVHEIETRLSVCDKLEETITHSLQQSEALRQSILKKAFEGKLIEQNPNDEPAAKQLERIKAGRERDEAKHETRKKINPEGMI